VLLAWPEVPQLQLQQFNAAREGGVSCIQTGKSAAVASLIACYQSRAFARYLW
jgi:hypothetical protein